MAKFDDDFSLQRVTYTIQESYTPVLIQTLPSPYQFTVYSNSSVIYSKYCFHSVPPYKGLQI